MYHWMQIRGEVVNESGLKAVFSLFPVGSMCFLGLRLQGARFNQPFPFRCAEP